MLIYNDDSTLILTKVLTMILTNNEGLRMRYYLHSINKRGWGVIYAILQVGEKRLRISTHIKVKSDYWGNGIIQIPSNGMKSEKFIHKVAYNSLNDVKSKIDEIYYDYLCNDSDDTNKLIEDIRITLNPMAKKVKKQPQSIVAMLKSIVRENPNEKTQKAQLTMVNKFASFLKEKGLRDELTSMCQQNIRSYRDWIFHELSSSTAKTNLSNLFAIIRKAEIKYEVNFHIDKNRIPKIVDGRTSEEKRDNCVALTKEDLVRLQDVTISSEREYLVRDLFLLACYTSVRFEDLTEVLNTSNHRVKDGVTYCIFKSEKTGITYHIPLNDARLYPQAIEIANKYADLELVPTNFNNVLKKIAKRAGLDMVFTFTSEKGGKKESKKMKVCDKISCHWGRHTCITNLVRYFKLDAKEIKYISGHADERMINQVYTNTTTDDNINIIADALGKEMETIKPIHDNYDIDGIAEAKSVMRFLGITFEDTITFEDAISKIAFAQMSLMEDYGVKIDTLKHLFNFSQPLHKRIEALKAILEVFK